MDRRTFLQLAAATPLAGAPPIENPVYRVVTRFKPAAHPGMPGPYPGKVVRVHSERAIEADAANERVDRALRILKRQGLLRRDSCRNHAGRRLRAPLRT